MFKKIAVSSLLISFVMLSAVTVKAAFEESYWGVRALGMGGAYTAVANDSNAPLYNIAGITNIEEKEVTLMGSRLFAGLENVEIAANYFGYVNPVSERIGAISFAWSSLSSPGLARYDTFNIGYARQVNDVFGVNPDVVKLSAGINLKYLNQEISFDEDDSDLSSSKGGVTGDIGLLAKFENGLSIGFSSKYVTTPDIGFVTEDKVSNMNVIGIAYYTDSVPFLRIPDFTIDIDTVFLDGETQVRVGIESFIITNKLAFRAGGREEGINVGFGYGITFANESQLIINYAIEIPLQVEESFGSNFVGLTFKFR